MVGFVPMIGSLLRHLEYSKRREAGACLPEFQLILNQTPLHVYSAGVSLYLILVALSQRYLGFELLST